MPKSRSLTIHGMHCFEGHDLRQMPRNLLQQLFQMLHIVVPKDVLGHLTVSYALDHRRMIATVRKDVTVGDVARSEQQRRFLLMQTSQPLLEFLMQRARSRDVSCATGTRAMRGDCIANQTRRCSGKSISGCCRFDGRELSRRYLHHCLLQLRMLA